MTSTAPISDIGVTLEVTAFFDPDTNTISYVVKDPASAACAIVDAVMDIDYAAGRIAYHSADRIIEHVGKHRLSVEWLIETHAHMRTLDSVIASSRQAQEMIEALDAMLNEFLRRTRETGDPLSYRPVLVNLADVVAAAVDLNRPVADSRSLVFDCAAVQPYVITGDRLLLGEAVENLIGNAAQYAKGGSTITCEVLAERHEAIIRITDHSEGIREDDLRAALRPFNGLGKQRRVARQSFGLGLWIVRLIVERHGGRVEVGRGKGGKARNRNGTEVTLRLPTGRL